MCIRDSLKTFHSQSIDSIERFGETVDVLMIHQEAIIESIAWNEENYFYLDRSSNKVIKTSQKLHPRLSRVTIEYFYKF